MDIVIIIPTYQEKENIVPLISQIKSVTKNLKDSFDILVVDDNSPDGTSNAVREIMLLDKSVHLLTGAKKGLGAAYIRGMRYALEKLNPEVVIEMDSDFSHNPADIERLLAEIKKGADFVIGSRYIAGGKISANWSVFRKANSKWGNRFARRIAGLKGVNDCTAGFRAINAELLKKVKIEELTTSGYSFQMRLLYECSKVGARIKEIPVEFIERKRGKTKIGFWDIIEFILDSFRIRKDRLKGN